MCVPMGEMFTWQAGDHQRLPQARPSEQERRGHLFLPRFRWRQLPIQRSMFTNRRSLSFSFEKLHLSRRCDRGRRGARQRFSERRKPQPRTESRSTRSVEPGPASHDAHCCSTGRFAKAGGRAHALKAWCSRAACCTALYASGALVLIETASPRAGRPSSAPVQTCSMHTGLSNFATSWHDTALDCCTSSVFEPPGRSQGGMPVKFSSLS
ncbi:hypothetical protein BD413DRAFT_119677 [Trametes elegans]|nr:hypothetical protein BD413DRAFT_119677 [Trametes elegans]